MSDRVYPLERNIIKIHNISTTESLRFCMHHPWCKNPQTWKSSKYFPLLETVASSDFAPVLCWALCQGFFALFIKLATQAMLTLALQFCLQSKLVVSVRKAKLRKWKHTDHLSITFHPNFLRECEGAKGTFIRKPVPERLNMESKFLLSSAVSSPFNLGVWWIQYAGLKSSGSGKLHVVVRMLKRTRLRSLLQLGFNVLLHHMQLCRELKHCSRSTQALLGRSNRLFRFIENMLIKISGCQLASSLAQRQDPLRGCKRWSWCRQYWAAVCPVNQHLLWCEELRHKGLKEEKNSSCCSYILFFLEKHGPSSYM